MKHKRDRFVYGRRHVKQAGKRDGRSWRWKLWPFLRKRKEPRPAFDDAVSVFEWELKEAAESDISALAEQWQKEDEHLKGEYCVALAERRQAHQRFRTESREAKEAGTAFETAREEFFELELPSLNPRWTIFWLSLIGVGEFALNAVVFEVLGSGRLETYIAALAVGLGVPLAGHWLGHALRQDNKTSGDWVLIAGLPVAVLGGLFALALLRTKFVEAAEIQELLGIDVTPQEFTMIFLLLNVLLFFVAMVCSYSGSHRDAPVYRSLRKKYLAACQGLRKESQEVKAVLNRLENAEKRLQRAREWRLKRYRALREEARSTSESADWLSLVYRNANMQARLSSEKPVCFRKDPPSVAVGLPRALDPEVPADWECAKAEDEVRREPELAAAQA